MRRRYRPVPLLVAATANDDAPSRDYYFIYEGGRTATAEIVKGRERFSERKKKLVVPTFDTFPELDDDYDACWFFFAEQ